MRGGGYKSGRQGALNIVRQIGPDCIFTEMYAAIRPKSVSLRQYGNRGPYFVFYRRYMALLG